MSTIPTPPAWARAVIVAQATEDMSDPQTDYFATRTVRTIALAWSRHTRDLFPEMRKAATRMPETAHLGPGRGHYLARVVYAQTGYDRQFGAYYEGGGSRYHDDLDDGCGVYFDTRAGAERFVAGEPAPADVEGIRFRWAITEDDIEHREKYSMGAGYYLTDEGRSSGWRVRKLWLAGTMDQIDWSLLAPAPVRPRATVIPFTVPGEAMIH